MANSRNLPTNVKAENGLLSCAMVRPNETLVICKRLGLTADQFSGPGQKRLYKGILELSRDGKTVDPVMLNNVVKGINGLMDALLDSPSTYTDDAVRDYTLVIIEHALAGDLIKAARAQATPLYEMQESVVDTARQLRDEMDAILLAHSRTQKQVIENPADTLERENGWSVRVGIPWFDERLRLPSGLVHSIGGDPSVGKSLIAYQTIGFNATKGCARKGKGVAMIMAEDKILDLQMTLLSQLEGKIDMVFVNRIRYDPAFKTEGNLNIVRELWDRHYGDIHFVAASIKDGPEAVLAAIEALPGEHFVVIDHAFAIVNQGKVQHDQQHRDYNKLYSGLETIADRCNHVILIFSQYKLSERGKKNPDRGQDAIIGGSIVANVSITMVNMWKPEGDFSQTPSGWQAVMIECVKVKARMVVDDETGVTKDPMDGPGIIRINLKHRVIGDPPEREIYL